MSAELQHCLLAGAWGGKKGWVLRDAFLVLLIFFWSGAVLTSAIGRHCLTPELSPTSGSYRKWPLHAEQQLDW